MTKESPRFIEKITKSGKSIRIHTPLEDSPSDQREENSKLTDNTTPIANLVEIHFVPSGDRKKPIVERVGQFPRQKSGSVTFIDIDSSPVFRDEVEAIIPVLSQPHIEALFTIFGIKSKTPERIVFEASHSDIKSPVQTKKQQEALLV